MVENNSLNVFLENLQDQTIQEKIIKLIHANNPFAVFEKKNIEYNGSYSEYIGTQPLEGVQWDKDLSSADFKEIPEVFSCFLEITLDMVYPSIINKKVMQRSV